MKNTEKKNGITELVFILDKSGSMSGLEDDTVGGFNSMLEKQRERDGVCFVSTVLFNERSTVIHDRVRINDVERLTRADYVPCGSTALLDAVGDAIHHIANIHKYARPEDVPEHTMFVITTDGMENASRRYEKERIKRMIEEKQSRDGWEFLFIGANIDAVSTAAGYGIKRGRAVEYRADREGTRAVYEAVSLAADMVRGGRVDETWSLGISEDMKKRR